ncbi:MAG TPA: hypothetical protein VLT47_02225 [Anaeromyxobacteraceae bacterium]|nr:hypothetical protein [Anaeromyxobacteraceae bacterium]
MSAETNASAQVSLTPEALEKLWKALWWSYERREDDRQHAYDEYDRYSCKVAANAAGFNLDLVHDAFTPGRGWCTVDCEHIRAGLSPAQVAAILAQIDHHIARTEEKSKSPSVGADGRSENAELRRLRAAILEAATTS